MAAVFAGVVLSLPIGSYPATECVPVPPPEPIHHVGGTVINQLGEPIPNAEVSVLRESLEVAAQQTGKDGKFSLEQLDAAKYNIQVYGEGYLDAYFSVVIVKPGTKCERALQVGLAVGMGCSGASLVKAKKLK